jgi:hypothetical protein
MVAAASLSFSATASADSDQQYLDNLKMWGIQYTSPEQAISRAHTMCVDSADGMSQSQIAALMNTDPTFTMEPDHAQWLVRLSLEQYCMSEMWTH